jgi:hypothetical protein
MQTQKSPNLILGIVSIIIMFLGIGCRANGYQAGDWIIGASFLLGAIHWIWAIVDVSKTTTLRPSQKKFWLIITIVVPFFGSMIYYLMHWQSGRVA